MPITLQSAVLELQQAVPSFPIDSEWEENNLSYLAFNDFARFICSQGEVLRYLKPHDDVHRFSEVPRCMQFLERALEEGDAGVHDLILETIETLLECSYQEEIKNYAGPQVTAIWNSITLRRNPKID